ncbi:type VI secretion system-associated FHA domain protein TagH [Aquabacterium sp.]|uniref:type VI secretion system-associated FHA domain protein TagH n=1 Tax=Aquabacterium sp. TaxID=1872578 RepID=UPI002BAE428C|nr:type VI secretion system-associated FHA domain protein TagH [Aquabacterium sp.]HSW03635.1 type VI secretion system-associated FHA domain protein TagH [Aquabacterium sp.]
MTITLLAVSLNEQPLSQPITACFDANGGTIGRADHNTMALPDPERHISRLQAEIVATGSRYVIKNVGAANPIVIGGRSLSQGESAPLADRDQVRIGGYLLQVVVDAEDDMRGADITRGRAAVAAGNTLADFRQDFRADPRQEARPEQRPEAWHREPNPAISPAPRTSAPPSVGGLADFGTPLSSSNPFADLMGSPAPPAPAPAGRRAGAPTGNTFADLMPAPAGVRAGSSALGGGPAGGNAGAARLPDDFDPFAAPPPPRAPSVPAPTPGGGLFEGLIPSAAPSSIDDAFGLKPAAGRDPLADFMAGLPAGGPGAPAAAAGPPGVPTDPLALFGGTDRPPPGPAHSAHDHTPDLMAGFVPPRVMSPPPAPLRPPATSSMVPPAVHNPVLPTRFDWQVTAVPPTRPPMVSPLPPELLPSALRESAPPAGQTSGQSDIDLEFSTTSGMRKPTPGAVYNAAPAAPVAPAPARAAPPQAVPRAAASATAPDALWASFCQGAGIDPTLAAGLDEAMMHDIGALLRSAVDGTLQLMSVRATTKHELRAAVTIIQQRGNNPLKFSPDATTGLEQLLRPTMRGFLSGPAAMTDAMHDLVGHAIGTVAGMRAALDGMLERFAPGQLESKLVGQSLLDSMLPMNRKAKLWTLYLQHFESIREEAQEDFHSLFGKAFLAAYDQQLERLKQGGDSG